MVTWASQLNELIAARHREEISKTVAALGRGLLPMFVVLPAVRPTPGSAPAVGKPELVGFEPTEFVARSPDWLLGAYRLQQVSQSYLPKTREVPVNYALFDARRLLQLRDSTRAPSRAVAGVYLSPVELGALTTLQLLEILRPYYPSPFLERLSRPADVRPRRPLELAAPLNPGAFYTAVRQADCGGQ